MKTCAIITAAGQGKRMGRPKQFIKLGAKSLLERTLSVFERSEAINGIILVVNPEDIRKTKKFRMRKLVKVVAGGKERQDSVYNGLKALPEDAEMVVIHDGARPFVTAEIIKRAVTEAKTYKAVLVGVPVTDTIKRVIGGRLMVSGTVDRSQLWAAQTPQVFKKNVIFKAYAHGRKEPATDDAMLVEKMGIPVKMVMGSYENIKITTVEDLKIAEALLSRSAAS